MAENSRKLTIGMACFDDFDGVWFSLTALRMFHREVLDEVEFLIVDNNPDSMSGQTVKDFVTNWVPNSKYVPMIETVGTAATRDFIFREAMTDYVMCMDCHVLFEPDSIRRLIEFFDENPECMDLLQGPLVYDDLKSFSTHFDDVWRDEMWGTWATDPRGEVTRNSAEEIDPTTGERSVRVEVDEQPPFEIPAQGLGMFACRKEAWLGFNKHFRGFGGEEFYIHHKFRQAGRKCLCLPFVRWVHRFNRPQGIPYPLTIDDKFRNYMIGLTELNLPVEWAIDHFSERLNPERMNAIIDEVQTLDIGNNKQRQAARLRAEIAELQKQLDALLNLT